MKVGPSFDNLFTLNAGVVARGYSAKLTKNRCRLDLRRHFNSERVVSRWNSLEQQVIDAATLNTFKSSLDRIRKTPIGFLMDSLTVTAWPTRSLGCPPLLLRQVQPHLGRVAIQDRSRLVASAASVIG